MNVIGLLLASTLSVAPGKEVVNHNQPYHSGQPIVRRFERQSEDDARRRAWEAYVRELDDLWIEYRDAGSTPRAWQKYQAAAAEARRSYVVRDPYYVAITP
ncbi:MAG TPA: hypothetical protein VFE24_10280 [Pirellulales bacterium]|jgi:hypothetical protein|nr:hypothetical protein [Pirellulales bacterium]